MKKKEVLKELKNLIEALSLNYNRAKRIQTITAEEIKCLVAQNEDNFFYNLKEKEENNFKRDLRKQMQNVEERQRRETIIEQILNYLENNRIALIDTDTIGNIDLRDCLVDDNYLIEKLSEEIELWKGK